MTGQRPQMRVSVVLDLTDSPGADDVACMREVLEALQNQHDIGDEFSVIAAGPRGGEVVSPGDFGYGELLVATDYLFEDGPAPQAIVTEGELSLVDAVYAAQSNVAAGAEDDDALGSQLVIVVSPHLTNHDVTLLASPFEDGALIGIPASVIETGRLDNPGGLEDLALYGRARFDTLGCPTTPKPPSATRSWQTAGPWRGPCVLGSGWPRGLSSSRCWTPRI